jgi:hypothetical protein
MLQSLGEQIRLCYERAAEAKQRAEETSDPEAWADFLTMEKRCSLGAKLPTERKSEGFRLHNS